jgi:hypothetical protein
MTGAGIGISFVGPESDYIFTSLGRFLIELSPLKVLEQFGLSARGSYSELRGKSVLGLGASLEAIPSLLRAFPIKTPYYI